MGEFTFEVRHIPGKLNVVADGLSRCHLMTIEQEEKLRRVHNDVVGHHGVHRTIEMLKKSNINWEGMSDSVEEFINACPCCQKNRLGQGDVQVEVKSTARYEPFEVIAVDTVGELPECQGMKFVIVMIDVFTRFVELRAVPDTTAKSAATALLDLFGRYGPPRELRSDQGTQFKNQLIKEFMKSVYGGVKQDFTLAYHPSTNGLVERVNGEVLRHVRDLIMTRQDNIDWVTSLPLVQRIINSRPHSETGIAPARMLFGDSITMDRGLLFDFPNRNNVVENHVVVTDYMKTLLKVQTNLLQRAAERQRSRVEQRKEQRTPTAPTTYEIGDEVLCRYPNRPPTKLAPRWRGPMRVVDRHGVVYELYDRIAQTTVKKHVDDLKKFNRRGTMTEDELLKLETSDSDHFVVEKIVEYSGDKRSRNLEFKIRWKDYGEEYDLWLPL